MCYFTTEIHENYQWMMKNCWKTSTKNNSVKWQEFHIFEVIKTRPLTIDITKLRWELWSWPTQKRNFYPKIFLCLHIPHSRHCPGSSRDHLSTGQLCRRQIIWKVIYLRSNFGGILSGGSYLQGNHSGEIILGGNCLGEGAIIRGTIFRKTDLFFNK